MMDLRSPVQVVLQDAGYETWLLSVDGVRVIVFEDDAVMGFVCLFEDVPSLLRDWRALETTLLTRHAASLQRGEIRLGTCTVFFSRRRVQMRSERAKFDGSRRIWNELESLRRVA